MKDLKTIKQSKIEKLLDSFVSKKFICLILGTILLIKGFITGTEWIILAGIYMGINVAQKAFQSHRENRENGKELL